MEANYSEHRRDKQMNMSRKLGILVLFGVPAIIGGGIVYTGFGSYPPVFIYEAMLLLIAGGFFSQ